MSLRRFLAVALSCAGILPLLGQSPPAGQPEAFQVSALYHVGFWVRDIQKSRAFYETYLGFAEPYTLNYATGGLQMVIIKVNEGQSIYLFPNPAKILPNGDNLDHLGLVTSDAAALHDELSAKGASVSAVHKARVGDLIFGIKDPDGHPYEVTQFESDGQLMKHQGQGLPLTRISSVLLSATISTSDPGASIAYYRDKLGFEEVRRERAGDDSADPIGLSIPGSPSQIILRPYTAKPGAVAPRALPEFSLQVVDVAKAVEILDQRAAAGGFPKPGPITQGPQGRQTSCVDPDGTTIVLAEGIR
jgi:catechol 2,3-dioxygenase-like lactoylglutathione lyase family enzyme